MGKIISAGGNISRIMTRGCYMSIIAAQNWDPMFTSDEYSRKEIHFWKQNLANANVSYYMAGSESAGAR